jgi:hypothetical protein
VQPSLILYCKLEQDLAITGLQEGLKDGVLRKHALIQNLSAVQLSYVVQSGWMDALPEYRDHLVSVQRMNLVQESVLNPIL